MKISFQALTEAAAFGILDRPTAHPVFRIRMVRTWKQRTDFYVALATQLTKLHLTAEGLICAR